MIIIERLHDLLLHEQHGVPKGFLQKQLSATMRTNIDERVHFNYIQRKQNEINFEGTACTSMISVLSHFVFLVYSYVSYS